MTGDRKIYRLAYGVACIILGATFLAAGYHKVMDPPAFAAAVRAYELLPNGLVPISALFFQWLEIVCGVCLLAVPRLRVAALWTVLVLLILFSGAIGINLLRGMEISCGCFSTAPHTQPMSWMSVVRNLLLMLMAGMALTARKRSRRDADGTDD
ncbi:MauE/DoxX family redox-associated membrane protein [Pontiella sp.]|uniref:MauE/DoxX family redox-associated membrane protein n=1 Tax=Pontiella sp. TaxID=2837462 RepID=UPI003567D6AA